MCATTGAQPDWFATTHWTMVLSAGRAEGRDSRAALERLCRMYWIPLYSYVRRRGYLPEDAQDLTQEFFLRLLEQNRVSHADPGKGRFRSFLLASLKNFLCDEWDKARAQKRGGDVQIVPMEFVVGEAVYALEPADNVTPEQIYERRWALTVLDTVLRRLEVEQMREGKAQLFQALSPCLTGERTAQPYEALGEQLGMSETAVKSAVHRLRRRYRDLLRREIANTVESAEEIDEELRRLLEIVARP